MGTPQTLCVCSTGQLVLAETPWETRQHPMALHPKGRHSVHSHYGKLTLSAGVCGRPGFLQCCYFVNCSDERGSAGEFAVFHIMSRILEAANGMCMPLPPGKFCVLLF